MTQIDPRIEEILTKYDEPTVGNIWFVQGQAVIYHKVVERIGAKAKIAFEEPTVIRKERDEAVIMVRGQLGERWDYDIGEALVNVNYRVSGRQAAYVYAMALKRGRDRLILKLIGLHGLLYSEDEADEFLDSRPVAAPEPEKHAEKRANVVNIGGISPEKRKLLHERARKKCRAGREPWLTWREQLTATQREVVDEISEELNDILREQAVQRGESA